MLRRRHWPGSRWACSMSRRRARLPSSIRSFKRMKKTFLAVMTFVGLMMAPHVLTPLQKWKTFDPRSIPAVWDMPVPKPAGDPGPGIEELRAHRLEVMAPQNLVDPRHELDHFYAALLRGEGVRV